jgi:hypothetical protein
METPDTIPWTPDLLSITHPVAWDRTIIFTEKGHQYAVDWSSNGTFETDSITSVTSFIQDTCFTPFNALKTIKKMRASRNWPNSKYRHLTDSEIEAQWLTQSQRAQSAGTCMHKQIENSFRGVFPREPHSAEFVQFLVYADQMTDRWVAFRTEWKIRTCVLYKLVGTVDMLYMAKDRMERGSVRNGRRVLHLRMVDWKRTKEVKKHNRWQNGRGPASDLPDANYFHYALQLNIYKYIIERWYKDITVDGVEYQDIVIDHMSIVVMHPTARLFFSEFKLPNYQCRVEALMQSRRTTLRMQTQPADIGSNGVS